MKKKKLPKLTRRTACVPSQSLIPATSKTKSCCRKVQELTQDFLQDWPREVTQHPCEQQGEREEAAIHDSCRSEMLLANPLQAWSSTPWPVGAPALLQFSGLIDYPRGAYGPLESGCQGIGLRELEKELLRERGRNPLPGGLSRASSLVDMYLKCGSLVNALWVFGKIQCNNVVSWTVVVFGYMQNGELAIGLERFTWMQLEGCDPGDQTFVAAIKLGGDVSQVQSVVDARQSL
ncbi:putative pentatricopeptide repeat-containing protein At1g68930 [Selaginella moellendorffii]|uniref:putative pentatricopeptide repeat-containing protein At1g68930 n=1 Tax=Selaginella moellendorffii TaxID=88036 RepID=UPI000D1C2119|nr:putative pentatricopeptide repeat-containing protein At1g68930 [Selaginella moellendorffii]|eukprot:XP_024537076.1 putative pentatricopeptide repeat-containing protein At1g68930 [Selaginella moellendorffii]